MTAAIPTRPPDELFELLERHLPIRVVRAAPLTAPPNPAMMALDPQAVARLPESLRRDFLRALECSDMAGIAALIAQVTELEKTLGLWLQQKATMFEYAHIIRALKETQVI